MTDKDIIDRYFREVDAEAERYRDKQVDQPEPRVVQLAFLVGQVVYLKVAECPVAGMVTNVDICPHGATYHVTWGDTRVSTPHYDIELTTERSF